MAQLLAGRPSRPNPLDRSDSPQSVVVVGGGDGALIEIIRSCVQSFDQGALLDAILLASLQDESLREGVGRIEDPATAPEARFKDYCELKNDRVTEVLAYNVRKTKVYWLLKKSPFTEFSLPINRF